MQEARTGPPRPEGVTAAVGEGSAVPAGSVLLQRDVVPAPGATDQASSLPLWTAAFPAAWWRRVLGGAPVHVRASGQDLRLLGTRAGATLRLGPVPGGEREVTSLLEEVDWLWVDGAQGPITWSAETTVELPGVVVVVPTYQREQDATEQAERFAAMQEVCEVVVIDQGGTLSDHAPFQDLAARSGTIRLVSQDNLGGSGGYARGMLEAARHPGAAMLLSDDDAVLSAESLRRMVTFQALSRTPTIVGTPLFSSEHPSRLMAHAEAVRPGDFQWGPSDDLRTGVDLGGTTPARWGFLAARSEANYSGWWGTLFPPGTVADLGLPAPLFLKWDDAEYGLRATRQGYRHAVLPGTAVHHPPWNTFRTQMTWTARVLHRNRLAIAAAYGARRGVLLSSALHQCKHILAGHLLTAELWQDGLDVFAAGPETWLGVDLRHARRDGTRIEQDWLRRHRVGDAPAPTHASPLPLLPAVTHALARLLLPDRRPRIVVAVPAPEVHWRSTIGADTVVITEHGAPRTVFTVHGSEARRALGRTLRTHLRLALRWGALRRRYRRALPPQTTASSWESRFDATPPEAPGDPR